jgi:hypothetical protein
MSEQGDMWDELDRLYFERPPRRAGSSTTPDADDVMPLDPDLDDLPDELRERPGPFRISGVDRETGERFEGQVSRDDLARGLADARRLRELGDDSA